MCDFGYCWKAAWSFFDKGDPHAEQWVAGRALQILQGNARAVVAGIRRRATTHGYTGTERDGGCRRLRRLPRRQGPLPGLRHRPRQGLADRYRDHRGPCRYIAADRLGITGARWGLEGAEAILKLRAVIANGDFDRYWRYHLRKEHERIHHARYRENYILAA